MSAIEDDQNIHSIKEQANWPLLSTHQVDQSMIKSSKNKASQLIHFILYPYRYFNLVVFVFSALANNLIVQTGTPIVKRLSFLYDQSNSVVSLGSLIFYISHPPMAFVSNFIMGKLGMKAGISFGVITMIIGTGIRCLINQSFYFFLLGQFINAVGNCFITNSPAKIAANWFEPKSRPGVTAISSFAVLASSIVGMVIPPLFVNSKSGENDVFMLMFVEFLIVGAIMVINLIFFRAEPPTPPSFGALQQKENFKQSLLSLYKNKNYLLLLAFFTLLLGTINAYFTSIALLIGAFGFDGSDASLISVFCSTFGLVGSIAGAIALKITRKYKHIMFIGTLLGVLLLLIQMAALTQGTAYKWVVYSFAGLSGFFAYPVFSTTMELGCEISFPVGEGSVVGYLMAGSQIYGFVLGLIMTSYLDGESKYKSEIGAMILQVSLFLSLIPLYFVQQDLRRSQKEIKGTLIQHPQLGQALEKEIKEEYMIDNVASKIVQEDIKNNL